MNKVIGLLLILCGIIVFVLGIFYPHSKEKKVICKITEDNITKEEEFSIDSNGSVIKYISSTKTNYDEKSDSEFESICKDIDKSNYYSTDGIYRYKKYCAKSSKNAYEDIIINYDLMTEESRNTEQYKNAFEYVDLSGNLNEDKYIKDMQDKNYSCE